MSFVWCRVLNEASEILLPLPPDAQFVFISVSLWVWVFACVWVWQGSRVHAYGGQRHVQVSCLRNLYFFEMESFIGSDRVTTQARLADPQASRDPPVSTPMLPSLGIVGVHDYTSILHRNCSGSYTWEVSSSPGGISHALFWSFLFIANVMCVGAHVLQAHKWGVCVGARVLWHTSEVYVSVHVCYGTQVKCVCQCMCAMACE